jgi:hypothetical protein
MEVVVDGRKGFQFPQEPRDVLAAVSAVNETLRAQGRAILALTVDGRSIAPGDVLADLAKMSVDQVQSLSVSTEAVSTLVQNCLAELEQALPELPQVCHSLAEIFQGQNPESGYEPFEQLAVIWKTIKERERQVFSALDIDLSQIEVNGEPISRIHDELNRYIEEAAEALKAGDCVLLGDLLEYELAPRAETEAAIVALLRAKIAP